MIRAYTFGGVLALLALAAPPTNRFAALNAFNGEVVRLRGEQRVFLGAQYGDAGEDPGTYTWTKCVPESGVFVVQASERLATLPPERVLWAARHEVCHVRLHGDAICSGSYAWALPARKLEMEAEVNRCVMTIVLDVEG